MILQSVCYHTMSDEKVAKVVILFRTASARFFEGTMQKLKTFMSQRVPAYTVPLRGTKCMAQGSGTDRGAC
jgi:hypothetical protein